MKAFQCFRKHTLVFRDPDELIRNAFRCYNLSVFYAQTVQQYIRIAIIILVSGRERIFLIRLVADFVAQIPQHIRYGLTAFQQIAASCQIGGKFFHVWPPGLTSQKWSTNLRTHGSSRRQEVDLRIMCISMEYIVGNTFDEVIVGIILKEFEMFVPMQVE